MLVNSLKGKYSSNLAHFIAGTKSSGRPRLVIGSPKVEEHLLSSACLSDWMHLTLEQRSAKIKQLYGTDVTRHTLRNFYLRNGVKQTPAYAKLYPNNKDPVKLESERIEFAMRLADYIVEGRPVIYFDETTFNPDMHQKKAWYYKGKRFAVPLRKQSMKKGAKYGFSVYGSVSDCIEGGGYFETHESSNKLDFCGYMERLEKHIIKKEGDPKPICILDNLSAHKGPDRRAIMNRFCKAEFIPTYSCELNGPIETLWAVLKRRVLPRWTKLIIKGTASKARLKALVKDELRHKIS